MAVKRRYRGLSGIRVDLSHLRSLEAAVTYDFDSVLRGLVTGLNRPLVIRGFNVVQSTAGLNAPVTSMKLKVADSAILHSSATEAGTILLTGQSDLDIQLDPSNPKLIGGWVNGAVNYVALDYRRATDTNTLDQVAVWSPSEKKELQKSIPLGYVMDYRIVLSTVGFGNFLPLYKVTLNASGQITSIAIAKPDLFRLAPGGAVPDPNFNFTKWNDSNGNRIEGSINQPGLNTSDFPWSRGDWAIENLKDYVDAVSTRFKEITGSAFWYADSSLSDVPLSLYNTWWDSVGSVMTSPGAFSFVMKLNMNSQKQDPAFTAAELAAGYVYRVITDKSPTGNGKLSSANGSQYLISGTSGSFTTPLNLTMRVKVGVTSISRSGTTATYTLDNSLSASPAHVFAYNNSPTYGTSQIKATITGSASNNFNVVDGLFTIQSATTISRTVPNSGATSDTSSGIQADGIVEDINSGFNIAQAVTGSKITSASRTSNVATITTASPHGYANGASITVEGVGAGFDGTFTISNVSANTFDYANVGANDSQSPSTAQARSSASAANPDAGPLHWTDNVDIKGVIGGLTIRLSSLATATGVSGANDFNTGGVTGTVRFTANDQVAFLKLERNKSINAGAAVYTITNNGITAQVTPNPVGATYIDNDGNTANVVVGDYFKLASEGENRWFKIINSSGQLGRIDGTTPSTGQRPAVSSPSQAIITKYNYDVVWVLGREDMPNSSDAYWIAMRSDKGTTPNLYLREMELELGEERQVNDNESLAVLTYIGSPNESATDPNYTEILSSGGWEFEQSIQIDAVDPQTKQVFLSSPPTFNIKRGDVIYDPSTGNSYTVAYALNVKTAVMVEDIEGLSVGANRKYRRPDFAMEDTDNLTAAIRKIDRVLAEINSINTRPVYDESCYIQWLEIDGGADNNGTNVIRSGYYITAPGGGKAYVLAASNTGSSFWPQEVMDPSAGTPMASRLLVHVIANSGTFVNGVTLTQDIPGVGPRTRTQVGALTNDGIWGDSSTGQVLKMPANTRTGLPGTTRTMDITTASRTANVTTITVSAAMADDVTVGDTVLVAGVGFGFDGTFLITDVLTNTTFTYDNAGANDTQSPVGATASIDRVINPYASYEADSSSGGKRELLLIANDTVREAGIDYFELEPGPGGHAIGGSTDADISKRASVRLIRGMPVNTRMRFRNLATFGMPPKTTTSVVNLQSAYDAGPTINISISNGPVQINGLGATTNALQVGNAWIQTADNAGIRTATDKNGSVGQEDRRYANVWSQQLNLKTHDGDPASEWVQKTASTVTNNSSLNVLATVTLPANKTVRLSASIVARKSNASNEYAAFRVESLAYREAGGAVQVGSPTITVIGATGGAAVYAATIDVNGNDMRVLVAGDSGHTVRWIGNLEYNVLGDGT